MAIDTFSIAFEMAGTTPSDEARRKAPMGGIGGDRGGFFGHYAEEAEASCVNC